MRADSLIPPAPQRHFAPLDVTVVVPTMNEADNIERFLDSVPNALPLVVVDSSDDATPEIIESIRPDARVVRAKANIPVARQLGAEAAETDWLLFTDADVILASDYLDRLGRVPLQENLGGVVGAKATVDGYTIYHRWFIRGQAALSVLGIPAASGSNMLVRRNALLGVGGFDARLSVNEDTEVMFRIKKAGWTVGFDPGLSVLSFDHRRLELGLARKVAHGAVRNTALWVGVLEDEVRRSDWGYWKSQTPSNVPRRASEPSELSL